jgi:nucleotide-binding universal stress UspA family protein
MANPRRILISVDNSEASEAAVKWTMENLYHEGDEVHLIHVIPRLQLAATYGAPPVDFLPYQVADQRPLGAGLAADF